MLKSDDSGSAPSRLTRYLKYALVLSIIVVLNYAGAWLAQQINFQIFPRHDSMLNMAILTLVLLYIFLMAIPFMPGIEIGLALMLMLGSKGALLVYLCTLTALSISFLVGRLIPPRSVCRFLKWLHLNKASILVRQIEPLNQHDRLKFLNERISPRLAMLFVKYRYLSIAALLNLPGNGLMGGGGGIALVIGMSKIIPFYAFVLLLIVAIAPVPLWFLLYGG
ncbi:hypothetical protein [Amphritea sp. HPY]|uniref:hypothetical protein n=1 Tax=Amphritea sp. HPY TaxID=3421652 RepID=UPI003D7DA169